MKRLTREEAIERLDELYAKLPSVQCKGLCHDSCTAIKLSRLERSRIRERGVELPPPMSGDRLQRLIAEDRTPRCPALSAVNTCRVYDVRPLICRTWGATPLTRCRYGCIPNGDFSDREVVEIMGEIEWLSHQVMPVVNGGDVSPRGGRADRRRGSGVRRRSR